MEILKPEKIVESFKTTLGTGFINANIYQRDIAIKKNTHTSIWVEIQKEVFRKAVEHIRDLQEYPHLSVISPSDQGDSVKLIYHFIIYYGRHLESISLGLAVTLPKSDLKIPTITDIIPGALFTEREIQEMMGVEVLGIPDNRRLFLPEDFPEGIYPWRKDESGPQDMLQVLPGKKGIANG